MAIYGQIWMLYTQKLANFPVGEVAELLEHET